MTTTTLPETVFRPTIPLQAVADVHRRIAETLQRCGDIDWRQIRVAVEGDRATLTGIVTTAFQRWAAEYAALDAPGIARVDNHLVIWPTEPVCRESVRDQ